MYFKCNAPEDVSLLRGIFQAPIYFNQVFDGAIVSIDVLQQPYEIANVLIPEAKYVCHDILDNSAKTISLAQRLSLLISEHISYGKIELNFYAEHLDLSD